MIYVAWRNPFSLKNLPDSQPESPIRGQAAAAGGLPANASHERYFNLPAPEILGRPGLSALRRTAGEGAELSNDAHGIMNRVFLHDQRVS